MTFVQSTTSIISSSAMMNSDTFGDFFINNLWQIILSIVGGIITVSLIELAKYLSRQLFRKKFKAIFGRDVANPDAFHIIYAHFKMLDIFNEKGERIRHPYFKPEEPEPGFGFSIERPVSSCEVRAAKYLATSIGLNIGNTPILSSDYETKGRLNISFISLGAFSNYKSIDAMNNAANRLITMNKESKFVSVFSGEPIKINIEEGFDYGLILKLHPKQFPDRVWITCMGIDEWGSSGAAWYLANKWNEIHKTVKGKSFGCIVKVKRGQDESTEPIFFVRTEDDVKSLVH